MAYRTLPGQLRRLPPEAHRPFSPAPSRDTFKDLLVFEERLKQNAERLQRQRRKYEAFLVALVTTTLFFAYKFFIAPSPYTLVHYLNVGLLLVCVTTLVLFFATGMYSEKIAYAYKFIPQANRALRSFNMYLNTRRPSSFIRSPFSLFRSVPPPPAGPSPPTSPPPARGAAPLHPIPPSTNPRGELIFSSKVSPAFREGYEKYRSEWERRRNTPPLTTPSLGRGPGRKGWFAWSSKRDASPTLAHTPPGAASSSPATVATPLRGRDNRTATSASRQGSRRRSGGTASNRSSRAASPASSISSVRGSSRASTPDLLNSGTTSGPEDHAGGHSAPASPRGGAKTINPSDDREVSSAHRPGRRHRPPPGSDKLVRGDSFSDLVALQEERGLLDGHGR